MVSYELEDGIATITIDDGKVNVLSPDTQRAIHDALDRAEQDQAVVLLTGRPGVFSAGFDLSILRLGREAAAGMVQGGFRLAARLLAHPAPVVVASSGHAIAMGAFLMACGDYRIGTAGPYKVVANELAIGLSFPHTPAAILRSRLTPAAVHRAILMAEEFDPARAVEAGWLDRVVAAEELPTVALEAARTFKRFDRSAFVTSKTRLIQSTVDAVRIALELDAVAPI